MFGDKIYGQILLTVAAENVNGGVENSGVGTRYRVSITGIGPDRGDDSRLQPGGQISSGPMFGDATPPSASVCCDNS